MVVAGVVLDKIDECELVLGVAAHIRNSKVKPLRVGRRVVVVFEDQTVAVGFG